MRAEGVAAYGGGCGLCWGEGCCSSGGEGARGAQGEAGGSHVGDDRGRGSLVSVEDASGGRREAGVAEAAGEVLAELCDDLCGDVARDGADGAVVPLARVATGRVRGSGYAGGREWARRAERGAAVRAGWHVVRAWDGRLGYVGEEVGGGSVGGKVGAAEGSAGTGGPGCAFWPALGGCGGITDR